jgi:hypothetical protein
MENLPAFIVRLIPADVVMSHRAIPIMLHQGVLHLAMSDPTDRSGLEEISFITGYSASPVAASDELIESAMARYYGIPPDELDSSPIGVLTDCEPVGAPVPAAPSPQPVEAGAFAQAPVIPEYPSEPPTPFSIPPPPLPEEDGSSPEPMVFEASQPPGVDWTGIPAMPEPESTDSFAGIQTATEVEEHVDLESLFASRVAGEHLDDQSAPAPQAQSIADAIQQEVGKKRHQAVQVGDNLFRVQPVVARVTEVLEEAVEEGGGAGPTVQAGGRMTPRAPEEPQRSAEQTRALILEATDRDAVARVLIGFVRAFVPRTAMFIVKKDILVGWMGTGRNVSDSAIKGIMIPLNTPSVFRTVCETGTDYFGNLPHTVVNDIFISALGDIRPRQVLLIPITVRGKAVCILYGDCGAEGGFSQDLGPVHLMVQIVSDAFEKLILEQKINRQVKR